MYPYTGFFSIGVVRGFVLRTFLHMRDDFLGDGGRGLISPAEGKVGIAARVILHSY